jgi:PTH1 family peptidyl-tRNA hydrolase
MIVIVGLGNPGKKYQNTRHNVGFMAVDAFAKINNFPEFKFQKKSNVLISENIIDDKKIILAKPQTFMNESGRSVKQLISDTGARIADLVIVHDDIDLPIGKIKIIKERGSAGHKGVESIIKNIGNNGLIRFRIGIGPENKTKAEKVVLKNFSEKEQKEINGTIQKVVNSLDLFVKEGLDKVMNEYNKVIV